MTAENFTKSLAFVLKDEGGNDDDPDDPGGRTSRGITQREYDAWRKERGLPTLDVWAAPQTDIEGIYKTEYWDPSCDAFPTGLDYLYFDMAVNAGPYRAAVLLQRALGINDVGRIGPVTRAAVRAAEPAASAQAAAARAAGARSSTCCVLSNAAISRIARENGLSIEGTGVKLGVRSTTPAGAASATRRPAPPNDCRASPCGPSSGSSRRPASRARATPTTVSSSFAQTCWPKGASSRCK